MDDQKIGAWFAISPGPHSPLLRLARVLRTSALVPVSDAFRANSERSLSISAIPPSLFSLGKRVKLAEIAASLMLFNDPRYENQSMPIEMGQRYQGLLNDLLTGTVNGPFRLAPGEIATSHFTDHAAEQFSSMYDTLMLSQLLLVWTSFETMAGDLWETALNIHPTLLASLRGTRGGPKDETKKLPIRYLEEHGYNLEHHMGTVLKDRFLFTKLDGIEEAYHSAFPNDCRVACKDFWEDPSLKAVSALRNLIVHRTCIVDKEFLAKRGPDPRIAHLALNDRFLPNGEMLSRLFADLFTFSASLISLVDDWLATH